MTRVSPSTSAVSILTRKGALSAGVKAPHNRMVSGDPTSVSTRCPLGAA
ncbi:MAG: hypothetical protein QOH68_2952, partial [Nocardioidaceae bacterium]|nr:hypothetical protein [Nocardioidaceae bacterium]